MQYVLSEEFEEQVRIVEGRGIKITNKVEYENIWNNGVNPYEKYNRNPSLLLPSYQSTTPSKSQEEFNQRLSKYIKLAKDPKTVFIYRHK